MKVSCKWLRELVAVGEVPNDELARRLTAAGIEVEGRHRFADFAGVVVAEVRAKKAHPNANKLTLVDVTVDGTTTTQVVCGAPNVPEPGALVLWGRPGARLPSGVVLAEKEVRGVVSPGMLCADDELGFSEDHGGIVVLSAADGFRRGDEVASVLSDEIFTLNITPNRGDCLGHFGVARELAALFGKKLTLPDAGYMQTGEHADIEIVDGGCSRYVAVVLEDVAVGASPLATRLRLQSLGVRAISNLVDATNLTMMETGQPLHAFDADQLRGGKVIVRAAIAGEKLTTLDGVERTLVADDLVIADAERAVALAGVMGGRDSEVTPSTKRILLESACFDGARVRKTAKRLGLHSEASHRFERGVDPSGVLDAGVACARRLGGRAMRFTDVYPRPVLPWVVTLRPARTSALMGFTIDAARQREILSLLGLDVAVGEPLRVTVPTRRLDLTREVDLIEEIARVHGYDAVPTTLPALRTPPPPRHPSPIDRARNALVGLGLDEAVTYAFVGPRDLDGFVDGPAPLALRNPIREELSTLRTSLVPGLLRALGRNQARGLGDVRLFEVGTVFLPRPSTLPHEPQHLAGVLAGRRDPVESWLQPGAPLDFFDAKAVVEGLLDALGHTARFKRPTPSRPWLHPGVAAELLIDGATVGVIGEVAPHLRARFDVAGTVFAFELDLSALPPPPPAPPYTEVRFPSVARDISFFCPADVAAADVRDAFVAVAEPLLVDVQVREDYRERGRVPDGQKSMLWTLTFRAADRTLTDAEIQAAFARLVGNLSARIPSVAVRA